MATRTGREDDGHASRCVRRKPFRAEDVAVGLFKHGNLLQQLKTQVALA